MYSLTSKAVEFAVVIGIIGIIALMIWPNKALAHCDTLDGPVVTEARLALETGNIAPVLKWVNKESEEEIRIAFDKATNVRSKGPEARELADIYFFETLVRLHRAGEGAPYTGLKPAGYVEPPVAAADKAIADGDVEALAGEIAEAAERGIKARFEKLIEAKKHKDESVEAGREYVEAYVAFVHYVEELHNMISGDGGHH
ncbi:DUF6448 family protein [Acetomicrobium sp. S15 = DSM 107314]|uniref:DUF6448 family protein n=1 Tax=Acetomicrobium sp. S15 = DSM 107314 TaxID=2529858 RepID=UPI0018E19E7A|nr:DUF6448 family protein [Acetomicrobium sp. S15 = DSM 107314]